MLDQMHCLNILLKLYSFVSFYGRLTDINSQNMRKILSKVDNSHNISTEAERGT